MKYDWLEQYCLAKQGAVRDFKAEWDAARYLIGGKMFVMEGGDKEGKAIVTVKCEPAFGQFLRQTYEHIVPGYYMNKEHWNSVYVDGNVPDRVLKEMIDMSYELVLNSLTKKAIKEIAGG